MTPSRPDAPFVDSEGPDSRSFAGSPSLDADTIHLVRLGTDRPPLPLAELAPLLSRRERERALRFRRGHLHDRYVTSQGLLRLVLARFTDRPPEALEFRHSDHGKPFLENGPGFNLSHSGDHLLIGLVRGGRLGVDLEIPRHFPNLEALAERYFAPEEASELASLPEEERTGAFYRGWTRKEAFLKALGRGLSVPLESFAVRLAPEEGNTLVRIDPEVRALAEPEGSAGRTGPEGETAPAAATSAEPTPAETTPAETTASRRDAWWVASVSDPAGGEDEVEMAVAWNRGPARIRWVTPFP